MSLAAVGVNAPPFRIRILRIGLRAAIFTPGVPTSSPTALAAVGVLEVRSRVVLHLVGADLAPVLTQDGRLIASFTQDAMIRAFAPGGSPASMAVGSRL
jgi:hypothetical protein